jgi:hypothetical protein
MGFVATGTCVSNRKHFLIKMLGIAKSAERGTVAAAVDRDQGMLDFA